MKSNLLASNFLVHCSVLESRFYTQLEHEIQPIKALLREVAPTLSLLENSLVHIIGNTRGLLESYSSNIFIVW